MPHPPCHFLIGPPASGKSSFAQTLAQAYPSAVIVSTDAIRADLFGDAEIQGDWPQIEAQVLSQIQTALQAGKPIIYDATNVKRSWRMELLQNLNQPQLIWVAWVIHTPLLTCLKWNQQRQRQVPKQIIQDSYQELHRLEVLAAEGFTTVIAINPATEKLSVDAIHKKLKNLN